MSFTASRKDWGGIIPIPESNHLWHANLDHRLLGTPIVTILVGQFEHQFHVHRVLLCSHSLFFRQMLESPHFTEGKENVVRLPEDDVTSFAVFAHYLYVWDRCNMGSILKGSRGEDVDSCYEEDQSVVELGSDMNPVPQTDPTSYDCDFTLQFSCYVLADKLQAPMFKRLIMNEILGHGLFCKENLTTEHIYYAYENTIQKDDPLRRFCTMTKIEESSMEDKFADPELFTLMENGGPVARDIMQACGKQAIKQKQEIIESYKQEIQTCNDKIRELEGRVEGYRLGSIAPIFPAPYFQCAATNASLGAYYGAHPSTMYPYLTSATVPGGPLEVLSQRSRNAYYGLPLGTFTFHAH